MAISDYSLTAASNTSLSGINISGGGGRVSDGDNAIRQIMADIKGGVFGVIGYSTTATAAGTTTLTVASTSFQYFTGSTTQTVVMPVVTTLALGMAWVIVNNSTGVVTVNSSGGNLIATVAAGQNVTIQCILLTGTTAASWNAHRQTGLFPDGTVGLPGMAFLSDPDNGFYRIGANNWGASAAGAKILDFSATGLGVVGTVLNGNGTVSLPAFSFTSDPDSGVYRIGANNLGVAVNAAKVLDIGTGGLAVTGATSTTTTDTAASFIPSGSSVPTNGMYLPAANTLGWAVNSTGEVQLTATALSPITSDGNALGTTSLMWADLFLASGGVINWNAGDITITHAINAVVPDGSTGLIFNGSESGYAFNAVVGPATNDGAPLGDPAQAWSDLYLASGAVINFANSDVTITHSTNTLTFAGASSGYVFDALLNISGAAAGQIQFPATQNASANANTLDDYEEWTATATAAFATPGTSSFAYTTQSIAGVKIGGSVTIRYDMDFTPTIGTGSGTLTISGNPYTNNGQSTVFQVGTMDADWSWPASRTFIYGAMTTATSGLFLAGNGSAQATSALAASNMTSGNAHTFRANGTFLSA